MGGAFESFESDLSRAYTHFRIWGHLDGSNFENGVFAPPPRCHVLDNRAAPSPLHPSKKIAVLVLLLLATPQIFFSLDIHGRGSVHRGRVRRLGLENDPKNLVLLLFLALFGPSFLGLST